MKIRTFLLVLVGFCLIQSALTAFNPGFEPKTAEGNDLPAVSFVMPEVNIPRESVAIFPKKEKSKASKKIVFDFKKRLPPPSLLISKTVNKSTAAPGELFTFSIRYRAASLTQHASNSKIVDVLPSEMEIVSYTLPGGQVTGVSVSGNTITWSLASRGNHGRLDAGSTGMVTVSARFPACAASGPTAGNYTNTATFSAAGATSVNDSATVTLSSNVPSCITPPTATSDLIKARSNSVLSENNGYMAYRFTFPPSTVDYTVTDNLPNGYIPRSIKRILDEDGTKVKFEIQCANSGQWFTVFDAGSGSYNLDQTTELPVAATECIGVTNPVNADEEVFNVTAFRWTIPASTQTRTMQLGIRGHSLNPNPFDGLTVNYAAGGSGAALPNYAPLVAGNTLDNCIQSSDTSMGDNGESCTQSTVAISGPTPELEKAIIGSPTQTYPDFQDSSWPSIPLNNDTIPPFVQTSNDIIYGFNFKQNEYFGTSWEHPVVTDLLDSNVEYIPYPEGNNWWAISIEDEDSFLPGQNAFTDPDCSSPTFTVIENFNGTGRTLLRWDFAGCDTYGSGHDTNFYLYYSVRIKSGTPNGTVIKDMNIVPLETGNLCECSDGHEEEEEEKAYWAPTTDGVDFDGDGNTAELLCKSNVVSYTVSSETDLLSQKWVKGKLDGDFSRYPFSGTTDLTGEGSYQMFLENTGNVDITQLEVVDILPFVGDNGVLPATGTRNSEWSEELAAAITVERWNSTTSTWDAVPSGDLPLGLLYSTATNPCRFTNAITNNSDLTTSSAVGPTGCTSNPWTTSTSGARSFAFRFVPGTVFSPNEKLRITVPVQVNGNPPGCDDPACAGDVLTNNAVAWNSFAYGSYYDDGGSSTRLLDSEPIKVGLKMADLATHTSLGNYVWNDVNHDGIQSPIEDPLVGVTVSLWDNAGTTLLLQAQTDSMGFYRFYGLDENTTYKIRIDNIADFTSGALANFSLTTQNASGTTDALDSDAALNADGFPEITATVGTVTGSDVPSDPTEYPTSDFGFFQSNSIGDYVWYDANENGAQDSDEQPVINTTVNLYDVGTDGSIGGGDDVLIETQTTSTRGIYTFLDIPSGTYYVHFDKSTITGTDPISGTTVVASDWIFTNSFSTGDDFNDSDANGSTGNSGLISLLGNTHINSVDAGLKPSVSNPAAIQGTVWNDADANGIRAATEARIEGVQVVLLDNAGIYLAATYTDGSGRYYFTDLTPNQSYQVSFVPKATSTITLQNQGANDQVDSDANTTDGLTPAVTPTANQTIDYIDMGIVPPPTIGDYVWLDENGNGLQDASETGIGNITLTLHDMTNSGTIVGTAITNPDGSYTFGGYENENLNAVLSLGSDTKSATINQGSDDAEENISSANVSTGSSDLELCYDGSTKQLVGLRFNELGIPQGATITSANIQFSADDSSTPGAGSPQLVFKGDDSDNSGTFQSSDKISTRPTTTDSVLWSPATWPTESERAAAQLSPDLTTIVQEIVNRGGWANGNSMSFIISTTSSSGYRDVETFNDIPANAATLTVTYSTEDYTESPLESSHSYEIRMDLGQSGLENTVLTAANTGGITSNDPTLDNSDSDATESSGIANIALTSPAAGSQNNSYDFGLYFPVPEICANNFDDDADGLEDCEDPDCSYITLSNAVVSACIDHPLMDVATLDVNVSWTDAPTGDIIEISVNGKTERIDPSAVSSSQTINFTIPADGSTGNLLIAKWQNTTTLCPDTLLYNVPAACSNDTIGCSILYLCGEDKPYDGDAWDHGFMNYIDAVNGSATLDGILTKPDATGFGTYDIMSPTTFVNVNFDNYDMIFISPTTEAHIASDLVDSLKNFTGAVMNGNYLISDELGISGSSGGYQFQTHLYIDNSTQEEIYNYNNLNPTYSYVFTRGNPLAGADSYLWTNAGEQALDVNSVYFVYDINDNLSGVSANHGRRVYLGYHMNGTYANAQNGGALPAPAESYFNPAQHLTLIGKTYLDEALIAATLACNDEICDDLIDNDGNGLTDCEDPTCEAILTTIGSNSALCVGGTLNLTATGSGGTTPYTWAWTGPASFSSASQNPSRSNVTTAMSGDYILILSDVNGCTATDTTTVDIQAAPSITTAGADTICTGGTATLTATPTGGVGTCTIQWQSSPNGSSAWTNISGANATTYTTPALTTSTFYRATYTCTGTDCGTTNSNVQEITVVSDPNVNINGGNVTICTGGNVMLTASVGGGTGTISYQWQDSPDSTTFTNISGATAQTYNTGALTQTAYYQVLISFSGNGCESQTSTSASVTVVADPTISVSGEDNICTGGSVTLTATTSGGTGTCGIQWQYQNTGVWLNLTGETGSTYTTPNLTATTNYRARYSCTGGGCDLATATAHTITVNPDPTVTISVPNTQICEGGGVVLTATPSSGLGTCVLQWQSSSDGTTWSDISGENGTTYTTPNLSGNLYYQATYECDRAGCCD